MATKKNKAVTVYLEQFEFDDLNKEANKNRISVAAFCRQAIMEKLQRDVLNKKQGVVAQVSIPRPKINGFAGMGDKF